MIPAIFRRFPRNPGLSAIHGDTYAVPFRPPNDWSKRGQMSRLVLSILRTAKEPLTSREIAAQMLLERAMDAEDVKMLRGMTKRVSTALRDMNSHAISTTGPVADP